MKAHKNAVIRNRPSEKSSQKKRFMRCGRFLPAAHGRDPWRGVTCKNCLATKRKRYPRRVR